MRVGEQVLAAALVLAAGCGAGKPRGDALTTRTTTTTTTTRTGAGTTRTTTTTTTTATGSPVNGGPCAQMGEQVRDGQRFCVCADVCSGAEPEVPPPPEWSCVTRDAACPEAVPEAGARCARPGLTCTYGHCGGASATCAGDGRWTVDRIDPPA